MHHRAVAGGCVCAVPYQGPEPWLALPVLSFVNFTPHHPKIPVSLRAVWIILTRTYWRHLLTWSVLLCNLMWLLVVVQWAEQAPHSGYRRRGTLHLLHSLVQRNSSDHTGSAVFSPSIALVYCHSLHMCAYSTQQRTHYLLPAAASLLTDLPFLD